MRLRLKSPMFEGRLKHARWILAIALVGYASSPADAQTASSDSKPAGQITFKPSVNLTPQDQVVQADVLVARMKATSEAVRRQLETARAQRDVVKTLCLNDKLSQADVAARAAEERRVNLKSAAARNDRDLCNHEFTVLSVLSQRSSQLAAEANQCIGQDVSFIGETNTTMTVDPQTPSEADSEPPVADSSLISALPQCTSCSQ
jgi:hypothetical protein